MKWQISLTLILGICIGALSMMFFDSSEGDGPDNSEALEGASATIERLQGSLEQAELEKRELGGEVERLEKASRELEAKLIAMQQRENAKPAPTERAEKKTPPMQHATALAEMTATAMRRQNEMNLLALKSRLNLKPEQEEELRALFKQQAEAQLEMSQAMIKGEPLSPERTRELVSRRHGFQGALKKILTPEQFENYQKYQRNVTHQQRATMARQGMDVMSNLFDIKEKQKGPIMQILYESQTFVPEMEPGGDPTKMAAEYQRQRIAYQENKLRKVLTPEQLKIWRQAEEQKIELIKRNRFLMMEGNAK